jgi:hypothetical protein
VRAFTAELERESEAERAAAELVVWDDSESASEPILTELGRWCCFPAVTVMGFRE